MLIEEVVIEKYKEILKTVEYEYIYAFAEFNELNKYKVDQVKYLLFKDKKYRFALCIGIIDKNILCPFSAPFGMIMPLKSSMPIQYFDDAIIALNAYAYENEYKSIKFTLPPLFYNENDISMLTNSLYRNGYNIKMIDINFQIDLLSAYSENYIENIAHNARKNLRIGLQSELTLIQCLTDSERKEAYEVIAKNRQSKGFPLRMTYEQIADTIKLINSDFFIVKKEEETIASAIVFHINPTIAQVIYWGDAPGNSEYKSINYLSYKLINFYGKQGLCYLDIGPSTENSQPNYGLCDFKQSIGCNTSNKITFQNNLDNKL